VHVQPGLLAEVAGANDMPEWRPGTARDPRGDEAVEPGPALPRVTAVTPAVDQPVVGRAVAPGAFAELYEAAYPRVVAALARVAGSRDEAEDVAQEAFSRLVPRWDTVSRYDDPEAWVRSVAFRLLTSRWRRARTAARALVAMPRPEPAPEPSPDGVAVDAVLARLSVEHRQVLVLHHGLGLPVDAVARELGVPTGTVKSRLSRARAAAAAAWGEGPGDA
jgi:RNA polymerase sigma factor (sigma-70 family)